MRNQLMQLSKLVWLAIALPIILFFSRENGRFATDWEYSVHRIWLVGGAVTLAVLIWVLWIRVVDKHNERD